MKGGGGEERETPITNCCFYFRLIFFPRPFLWRLKKVQQWIKLKAQMSVLFCSFCFSSAFCLLPS